MEVPSDLRRHLIEVERASATAKLVELPYHLDGTATALALVGHVEPALELWKLARDPRLEPARTAFGDGSLSAVCHLTGRDDVSRGEPRPSWAKGEDEVGLLAVRAERHQAWLLARLLVAKGSPPPERRPAAPGEEFRRDQARHLEALDLLDRDEAAAVERLRALGAESRLPERTRLELVLLCAEHDARQGRDADVDRALRDWYERARRQGSTDAHTPLGLLGVGARCLAGALTDLGGIDAPEAERAVAAISANVRLRLDAEEEPNPAYPSYRVCPSYGQVYLEPRVASTEHAYFQDPADYERGYSLFDDHVALALPDIDEVEVRVEFVDALPQELGRVFPLRVHDDLYLRTVDLDDDARRFAVPSGEWHAGVRRDGQDLYVFLAPSG